MSQSSMPERAIANNKESSPDIRKKARKLRRSKPEGTILAIRWGKEKGISPSTVHMWMSDGRLPYVKRDGRYWVSQYAQPPEVRRRKN